jgi:hypothetical protein
VTAVTMDVSAEPGDGLDEQLVRQLAARARAEGLKLTGEGVWVPNWSSTAVTCGIAGRRS